MKRAAMDSFSCIPPHANHRNRSEISVNEHSWIKPFSTSVWSLIVFPRIFSYCQIKTPLFLLKNSFHVSRISANLVVTVTLHARVEVRRSHIFKFIPSPSLWQYNLNAVSTAEHTEKVHSAGAYTAHPPTHHVKICMQATCMPSKNAC